MWSLGPFDGWIFPSRLRDGDGRVSAHEFASALQRGCDSVLPTQALALYRTAAEQGGTLKRLLRAPERVRTRGLKQTNSKQQITTTTNSSSSNNNNDHQQPTTNNPTIPTNPQTNLSRKSPRWQHPRRRHSGHTLRAFRPQRAPAYHAGDGVHSQSARCECGSMGCCCWMMDGGDENKVLSSSLLMMMMIGFQIVYGKVKRVDSFDKLL